MAYHNCLYCDCDLSLACTGRLIANSFGSKWGMDGYFKMARGVGAGGIEQAVVAGTV